MNKNTLLTAFASISVVLVAIIFGGTREAPSILAGGVSEPSCSVSTTTLTTVGASISSQILATSTTRAYARIQATSSESNIIALSFDEDAPAVVGYGATVTAGGNIELGRATTFPYTGAVRAKANTSTTSILVMECNY